MRGMRSGFLAVLALAAAAAVPAAPVEAPRWTTGDTWTIKAEYAPLVLGRGKRPAGSLPKGADPRLVTYWTFRVVSVEEEEGGRRSAIVQVKDKEGHKQSLASLLFAAGPGEPLSLLGAKSIEVGPAGPEIQRFTFNQAGSDPRPVLAEASVIPHDFPAFPFDPAAEAPRAYEDTRGEGELRFAMDLVQTEHHDVAAGSITGRPGLVALLEKADLPTEGLTQVEVGRDFDGRFMRQLWAPGQPWPIYGENPVCRWHLIYSFYQEGRRRRPRTPGRKS